MVINGESVKLEWGWEALTRFDFQHNGWRRLTGGGWAAPDRGQLYDQRRAQVRAFLRIELLEDFIAHLSSYRGANSLTCTLSEGEEIFGAELDYSASYAVHLLGAQTLGETRDDPAFASIQLELLLAESPRLKAGVTPSWSPLVWPFEDEVQLEQKASSNVWMLPGAGRVWDEQVNRTFGAEFELFPAEVAAVKRAAMSARNQPFALPNPPRSIFGATEAPPYEVILLEWGAEKRIGLNQYSIALRFGLN